jgi:hypothetical protein
MRERSACLVTQHVRGKINIVVDFLMSYMTELRNGGKANPILACDSPTNEKLTQ